MTLYFVKFIDMYHCSSFHFFSILILLCVCLSPISKQGSCLPPFLLSYKVWVSVCKESAFVCCLHVAYFNNNYRSTYEENELIDCIKHEDHNNYFQIFQVLLLVIELQLRWSFKVAHILGYYIEWRERGQFDSQGSCPGHSYCGPTSPGWIYFCIGIELSILRGEQRIRKGGERGFCKRNDSRRAESTQG